MRGKIAKGSTRKFGPTKTQPGKAKRPWAEAAQKKDGAGKQEARELGQAGMEKTCAEARKERAKHENANQEWKVQRRKSDEGGRKERNAHRARK